MNFFRKYKKIMLAIVVIIILFFVYSFFFGGNNADEELISSTVNSRSAADVVGSEIIQALNQIESLELDRTIFEDPVYRSLVDRSEPIPAEPVGKENPFDPIDRTNVEGGNNDEVIDLPEEDEAIEETS